MGSFELRGLTEKLSFIKDFSSLVLPTIITFVAVLILGVTVLLGNKLKETVKKESIGQLSGKIKSLSRNSVSSGQADVEEKYQQDYLNDANYIEFLSLQTTQRALLSYKIFPSPKDLSYLIFKEFGEKFCEGIEKQLVRIKAVDCPTDAEINKHLEIAGLGRAGLSHVSRRSYGGTMGEVVSTIRQAVCEDKALSAFVYCNPANISGYEFWGQYQYLGATQAVEDCWYWQLAYWVIEDVLSTIGKLNSGSASAFTSPVKRLLEISFVAGSGGSYGLGKGAVSSSKTSYTAGKVTRPGYVLSTRGVSVKPYTKRSCDEDIDVIHFNISVVVSSKAVPHFMRELCSGKEHRFKGFQDDKEEQVFKHNQITILENAVLPVLQESKEHALYCYGDEAVVRLELVCEYIFNKKGYEEIIPEAVKKLFGGTEAALTGI
jgi:hypothetical protein